MQNKQIHHLIVGNLATNCWIYPLDSGAPDNAPDSVSGNGQADGFAPCAVIDPGEEGGSIIAFLDQHKLFPAYIILTHGHFDHIGAVSTLAKEYRSRSGAEKNVKIAIHAADAEYLGFDTDMLLQEGDTIGSFTVLHLPGHTPGSIALWDEKNGVMFTGDTLFCGGYGRTDLPGGNSRQLHASLMRLFDMKGDIQVYPGHDGITTIEREAMGLA